MSNTSYSATKVVTPEAAQLGKGQGIGLIVGGLRCIELTSLSQAAQLLSEALDTLQVALPYVEAAANREPTNAAGIARLQAAKRDLATIRVALSQSAPR